MLAQMAVARDSAGAERHPEDGWPIIAFANAKEFERWLDANHDGETGLWLKHAKKASGIESVSVDEAVEVALCFGWIDAKLNRLDDDHYVLRYQRRRPKSNWSARNKERVERLAAEGRMRPPGLAEVDAAKADGRWDAN
jgi:uncharacterized protein YdeI (YjbR/CyaY-like superfamily)